MKYNELDTLLTDPAESVISSIAHQQYEYAISSGVGIKRDDWGLNIIDDGELDVYLDEWRLEDFDAETKRIMKDETCTEWEAEVVNVYRNFLEH